jgi:hypothetical protein
MAPVSRVQATKANQAKLVNRREFDSHSEEEPEAALSFGHVLSFRARHAFVLCHPITHICHRAGRHQPDGGVTDMATGRRGGGQKVKNACRCLTSRNGLGLEWIADSSVACSSGRANDVTVLMLMLMLMFR